MNSIDIYTFAQSNISFHNHHKPQDILQKCRVNLISRWLDRKLLHINREQIAEIVWELHAELYVFVRKWSSIVIENEYCCGGKCTVKCAENRICVEMSSIATEIVSVWKVKWHFICIRKFTLSEFCWPILRV